MPLMNRVGHAFIKQRMRKDDAVFGGEVSAHYYFRDFAQADTGRRPVPAACSSCSRRGARSASEILAAIPLAVLPHGRDQHARSPTSALKLQELKERYGAEGARITHLDGVSVDFDDWHFNVRPSNTEPLLRLNLEALSTRPTMERRRDEVVALIRG